MNVDTWQKILMGLLCPLDAKDSKQAFLTWDYLLLLIGVQSSIGCSRQHPHHLCLASPLPNLFLHSNISPLQIKVSISDIGVVSAIHFRDILEKYRKFLELTDIS